MKALAEAAAFAALAVAAHVAFGLKLVGDVEPGVGDLSPAQVVLTLRAVSADVTRHVADWESQPAVLQEVVRPPGGSLNDEAPMRPLPVSAPAAVAPLASLAGSRATDARPADSAPLPRRPRPLLLTVRRAASVPAPPPAPPRRRSGRPDRADAPVRLPMPDPPGPALRPEM